MEDSDKEFVPNSITRQFVDQVKELIEAGKFSYKGIITKLNWNKSSMSSVMHGTRDVPVPIWELWQSVYKEANLKEEKKMEIHPHTQEHIDFLKKRLAELEAREDFLVNQVKASLDISLHNQLALGSLMESFLSSFSELMIEDELDQKLFCSDLHKAAFERLRVLVKTGNHIDIDNRDIKTS